jgi:hypothetical protein
VGALVCLPAASVAARIGLATLAAGIFNVFLLMLELFGGGRE